MKSCGNKKPVDDRLKMGAIMTDTAVIALMAID
jgi:hypothetical protein